LAHQTGCGKVEVTGPMGRGDFARAGWVPDEKILAIGKEITMKKGQQIF
jgi:hypothetical protein